MSNFVHLHVHSHFSLLSGLTKIKPLVKTAKKRGFNALALTDYGSLYGAIEFYKTCKAEGIKPIIGFEAFLAPNGHLSKRPRVDNKTSHLVLLAETYEGYKNLMRLSTIGHIDGFYYRPRIDKELLRAHSKGIIALSGCMAGELSGLINGEATKEQLHSVIQEYVDIFGSDNFFLELQDHPEINGQINVNSALIAAGKELGVPLVVTRDVHYLNPEDAQAQDILTCIKDGKTVDQPNRFSLAHVDRSLCTAEEIAGRFSHIPQALENTVKIADRIDVEIPLNKWHFPPVDIPEGKNADEELHDQVYARIKDLVEVTPEITERIDYELDVIKTKGYSPYFIAVADFLKFARDNDIVVTTRGSAAGSLVSYAMGIVSVNPMFFRLPFERFLNPYRPSPPDVDMDFADDRRDEVIAYATEKFGKDAVAQIITFGTMAARGSVRDVGRALGFSYNFCDQVAKLIPFGAQGFPMTIERALKEEPELKKLHDSNADVKRLLEAAQKIEGCARHTSIHAAGVVISPTTLTDFTPARRESGGDRITTQYEMKSVEAAGLLKFDFLGIRNLSILGHAVSFVEATTGKKIDITNLPWDDKKVYEMLAKGQTMGVFQLSGSGMTRWLKELRPTNIHDIMAMVALFRPGPMESIPQYIERKYDASKVEFLDPRLEKILEMSYGLLVYQEDVMLTAIELAGYDWLEADKFRKAMGKKIPEEMAKQKIQFYDGCKNHGKLPKEKIDTLWELIEPFAAYGFGKAHAASYAVVAYQTAYMKANYPVQFMTAVLTAESGDFDKIANVVHECESMGIPVLPPHINESFRDFAMIKDESGKEARIRFGFNAVKNVGAHIADVLYRERKENGPYKSFEDLLERVKDKDLNKKSIVALTQCGALDVFGYDRGVIIANIETILSFAREMQAEKLNENQGSLFGAGQLQAPKLHFADAPPASKEDKLHWEKELLGLYISAHPFDPIAARMGSAITPIAATKDIGASQWVVIGGIIDKLQRKITKKGKPMMFVTLEDKSGTSELLVFPKTLEKTQDSWQERATVCIMARSSDEEGDDKLFVEKVYPVSVESAEHLARQFSGIAPPTSAKGAVPPKQPQSKTATLNIEGALGERAGQLKQLFESHPGDTQMLLSVSQNGSTQTIKTPFKVDWELIAQQASDIAQA